MAYKYIQELQGTLQTGLGTEGQLLIERKIYDVLIDEVDKNLIPRSEAAIYIGPDGVPGSSVDVDLVTPDTLNIRIVGEGAEVPLSAPDYTSFNVKPLKYGVRITISKEMMEDAKWNLIEHSVRLAGNRLAENETNLIISALDDTGNSVTGGANLTIANLTAGMLTLENADFTPTTLLVGPEVLNDLREIDTFVETDKFGTREMLERGVVGTLYGMKVFRFSRQAAPSTTYSKYAYILDKNWAYLIVEKRPITVENYDLATHDMSGAVVTQRIAARRIRDNASTRITTT